MKIGDILAVITDIDGVLTDGKLMLCEGAEINKKLCFKDLDTVSMFHAKGIKFGIISGESDEFTNLVNQKMNPDYFFSGCKDKKKKLEEISENEGIALSSICYIGDGKYDIEALKAAGVGICPSDAIEEVKQVSNFVLERKGGDGCLASVFSLLLGEEDITLNTKKDIILRNFLNHKKIIDSIISDYDLLNIIYTIAEEISKSLKQGGQFLLCGNGGSAADAQHLATELVSRFYCERIALNAEALTVNTSTLTAVGNDYSFDKVFARQVEAKGRPDDILVGLSTSGESKNIIEAMKTAKQMNMKTVAFTGKKDSTLKNLADMTVAVPAEDTPRIQEMHILIGHIICELVEREFIKA